MTMTRFVLALTGAVVIAVPASAQETWTWNGAVANGRAIEIKGINGSIRAVASNDAQVHITARKTARRSNTADVRLEVVTHGDGVTVCAVYPTREGRPENECAAGEGGRMNVENNDVQVEFTVQVPRGVNFIGRTVNGRISGATLPADAEARTVNGDVSLTAAGLATAETVNGSIEAIVGSAAWQGGIDFKTVNGSITVSLPSTLNAVLNASTVNGEIMSDFPVEVRGRWGPKRVSGTIGNGGNRSLTLNTVNGGITIRSR
jgi:hypothetical protein